MEKSLCLKNVDKKRKFSVQFTIRTYNSQLYNTEIECCGPTEVVTKIVDFRKVSFKKNG